MNKKARKEALKEIQKEALLKTQNAVEGIMNNPSLNSIEDPQQYAHEVFQHLLLDLQDKLNKAADED